MAKWADKKKPLNLPSLSSCFEQAQTELISLFDEIDEVHFRDYMNVSSIPQYLLGMIAGQYIAAENPEKYRAMGLLIEVDNLKHLNNEMNKIMENKGFSSIYPPQEVSKRLEGLSKHIQIALGKSSGLPPLPG